MKLRNITATCCGALLQAPGLTVACPKCRTTFQIRETPDGDLMLAMLAVTRPRARWWRRALARLPVRRSSVPRITRQHLHRSSMKTDDLQFHATDVECPTCRAWKGWACAGRNYGYHAAGYHPRRESAARRAAAAKAISFEGPPSEGVDGPLTS